MKFSDLLNSNKNDKNFSYENFVSAQPSNVTLAEYAALSNDVYFKANDPGRLPLPPGWTRLIDSDAVDTKNTGYFGAVYVKNEKSPSAIIWAHKGTIPSDKKDLIADLQILLGQVPTQCKSALIFFQYALYYFKNKYGSEEVPEGTTIAATGHSLGGTLAELLHCRFNVPIITFENPGTKDILIKYLRSELAREGLPPLAIEGEIRETLVSMKKNSQNYCADINFINSYGEQLGKTFLVKPLAYNYLHDDSAMIRGQEITVNAGANSYYLLTYSFDQHQMLSIYNKLKEKPIVEPITNPIGFQQTYKAYLNYEKRKSYWDDYMKMYWDENFDMVQTDFAGDFEAFSEDFIKNLRKVHTRSFTIGDYEDVIPLTIGGLSLFAHPDDNKPDLSEDDFVMIENSQDEIADKKKSSRCVIM